MEPRKPNPVFYVVWNPDGRNPQVRHATREAAENEARRLAALNPSDSFYVMKAESVSKCDIVSTKVLESPRPAMQSQERIPDVVGVLQSIFNARCGITDPEDVLIRRLIA